MSIDIAGELEELKGRIRTLEGTYRRNDRQVLLSRIGGGPDPRSLSLAQPSEPRMALTSGFNLLGGALAYHGQANLLLDPTFEKLTDTVPFTTVAGTSGKWMAHYVLNSGDAPTSASLDRVFERIDPDNNPFNTAVAALALSWDAADEADLDVYLYPTTDFSPSQVPILPYLVAAVRLYTTWAYVQTVDDVTVSIQLLEGGTIVVESELQDYLLAEQWQAWIATLFEYGDWLWRLRVHIVKEVTDDEALLNIGIAEPQLNFAYTPDPTLFQPELGTWYPSSATTYLAGVISPDAFTADVNDWNPAGLSTANIIRAGSTAAFTYWIRGLEAQPGGRLIVLLNVSDYGFVIGHEDAGSTAANRFIGIAGTFVNLPPGAGAWIWYDDISSRWRVIGLG